MHQQKINIIITGRSGVGKSSFLNYLIGSDHFKTGNGSPITTEYFESCNFTSLDNIQFDLYDTVGIEPTNIEECTNKIIDKISEHDNSSNIFNWIHTVYYCFDASSKRIQPFEISFIKKLQKHTSIIILVTKIDLVSQEDLNLFINQIKNELNFRIQVIGVCSVEQKTRKRSSKKLGKEEVLKASFLGLWYKLAETLPQKQFTFIRNNEEYILKNHNDKNKLFLSSEHMGNEFKDFLVDYNLSYPKMSLVFLTNFPKLNISSLSSFNSNDRKTLIELIDSTLRYIRKTIKDIQNIDIKYFWQYNENKIKEIFDFYRKINHESPNILYSDISKITLEDIKCYVNSINITQFSRSLLESIHKLDNCIYFDSDEKKEVLKKYNTFRKYVMKIGKDLKELIDKFTIAYHVELYQYGRYCLKRNDLLDNMSDNFEEENELTAKEKIYFNTLKSYIKNNISFSQDERMLLEALRTTLNISYNKAGRIEDYIRNSL